MLTIDIITLFPGMFEGVLNASMMKLAQERGVVRMRLHDLREYTLDKHKKVDDKPFGGGPGMVIMPQPLFDCIEVIKAGEVVPVVLLCPQGKPFTHDIAIKLSQQKRIILICGHYEGIDERVREQLIMCEISIGDYVLTCGEIPAMVVIDAVTRLIPGALGHEESASTDSFANGLLEYPHYTRPADFRGMKVPDILLSGDHGKIAQWRHDQSVARTKERRPDLLKE